MFNKKSPRKTGKIIPNGVRPEPHELDTILYFTNLGKDIELIPPSHTPKIKRPDFRMDNLEWEAKSPLGNKRRTIERIFYAASNQSKNLIFDLRRVKGSTTPIITTLENCFKNTRKVRDLYIIAKSGELKIYKKIILAINAIMSYNLTK